MQNQENYQGQVGRYGIIRPIGVGGFADVYLARDLKLKRFVALKVLRFSLADTSPEQKTALNKAVSDEARIEERFYQEAEKIASLSHPNHHHIIEVYDYDRTERGNPKFDAPKPYLVMQLARNGSLKDLIKGKIFTPKQALVYLEQIAHALDYVYEQGNVIHMDVKPENVLLGEDNLLLLSDFGLIAIANSTNPTSYPLGTPPYSSPERYKRGYIARRPADVFSLGVIAYLLLCGVRPHPETKWQDYDELYDDPCYTLPTFRSKGVTNVPPDVEKAVRTALAFKPEERYTTCMEFIEALKQAINPPTPKIEVSKQTTSDLWINGKVSCIATLEGHTDSVLSSVFSPDGKLLASASSDNTVRLWEVATGKLILTLEGHTKGVLSSVFSPDGKLLASASKDKTVRMWEVATGKLIRTIEEGTNPFAVFSPDGKLLASGGHTTVKLWEIATEKIICTLKGHTSSVYSVAFPPDGKLLASASVDGTVRLWEPGTGRLIRTLEGHTDRIFSVVFSPDEKLLASASSDKTARIWEVATGKLIRTIEGHTSFVYSVAFSPDGKLLASASNDKTVRMWEVATGKLIRTIEGHTSGVLSAVFSPDGKLLASASWDNTVKLWKAE